MRQSAARMDMLDSINTARQNVSAGHQQKPNHIGSATSFRRNWEGSNEKGEFRSFMSDLRFGCKRGQIKESRCLPGSRASTSWTTMRLRFDCSDDEFRSIEASLYPVLHRTTANEPLRRVQQTERTERIRSMACNSEEIRSVEHVRQKISICSVDQQHL